jgi:tRNA(adenine34) deaminase
MTMICTEPTTDAFTTEDHFWMTAALRLAKRAADLEEIPVGAILVHDGQIIGEGFNQPITQHDPTAHAEICALRDACKRLKNYRLPPDTTLYVTLEPCTQCVGAMIHGRVARVIYAAEEPRAGSLVSARKLLDSGFYNHKFNFTGGLMAEESAILLKNFFKSRRDSRPKKLGADDEF